jgi:hypothetical protein
MKRSHLMALSLTSALTVLAPLSANALPVTLFGSVTDSQTLFTATFGHECQAGATQAFCASRFGGGPVPLNLGGVNWRATLTVEEENNAIPRNIGRVDAVFVRGTIQHLIAVPGHPDELAPGPLLTLGIGVDAFGEGIFRDRSQLPHRNSPDHSDIAEFLDVTVQRGSGRNDLDIVSWRVTARGFHDPPPVPEPTAVLLFGVGAIGLCGWAAHRRRAGAARS